MLFSRLQQALGWQPASVGAVRDGRIRVLMELGGGRSTRVVRHRPSKPGRPPQSKRRLLCSEEARGGARRATDRHVSDE